MNKTIEETTKELNLNLDVSLALAKAESNLNELAFFDEQLKI